MNIEKPSTQLGGIANLALLAPVRKGFIPGAEPFTYAKRLENFFKTLNAIRLGSRESTLHESPFPDAIGRWGILQSFRYALIPPEIGSAGEPVPESDELVAGVYRLYLNVTFDGGWEPYMRVIYRDIGSLLDAIFCNCEGYPASSRHSYDEYIIWVRGREIPAGIFYAESPKSVQDQRYLERVERTMRDASVPAAARREIAGYSLPPPKSLMQSIAEFAAAPAAVQAETIDSNLRALKGLYDLRAFYADNKENDDQCLLRFAQEAMREFSAALPRIMPGLPQTVQARAKPLVDWILGASKPIDPPKMEPPALADEQIQSGILSSYTGVTHGSLFLLAITDAGKARKFLARLEPQVTTEAPSPQQEPLPHGVHYCNVAFTAHGLAKLGVTELGLFPQEFLEGMEARAGLLGDLRGNHPDRWQRPKFEGGDIDFASVHIVLQYRLRGDASDQSADLHEALKKIGQSLRGGDNGLRLLSAEPMRSFPEDQTNITREHFGFRDGFSQPVAHRKGPAAGAKWDDGVGDGELFIGHANDRDDPPYPQARSALRDNGSFLVVRKIRQYVQAWNKTLRAAAQRRAPGFATSTPQQQGAAIDALAAKLMGRDKDGNTFASGTAQSGNDFDYAGDARGENCPFQSHARRANPRTSLGPKAKMPRIVRRGMSYGPRLQAAEETETERGLYFMAYCGSISEQFEIIQRWLAGGNSSGILAAHSDPLLGVPQDGVPRSFQWLEAGEVQHIDLGEPLTRLEWGLYLFVPSRTGLKELGKEPAGAVPQERLPLKRGDYDPAGLEFDTWREHISARENRDDLWRRVNDSGGDLQTPYGRLVSDPATVFEILRDGGSKYSVCGYRRRFAGSIGEGFLGMDPDGGHQQLAIDSHINASIASITEEDAFYAARKVATDMLQDLELPSTGTNVDVAQLAERVLAALCTLWFGLPDKTGKYMAPGASAVPIEGDKMPRCPRDFVLGARHIFGAHPTKWESAKGTAQGDLIRKGVVAFLRSAEWKTLPDNEAVLAKEIEGLLNGATTELVAQTIAGVMLGFAPSTHGNFVNLLRAWSERTADMTLWDLQTALLEAKPSTAAGQGYETVRDTLRAPLIAQMRKEPIPATVWREKTGSTKDDEAPEPEKIVIGLHGVMQHDGMHEMMMWGGVLDGFVPPKETMPPLPGNINLHTVHACPGYGMATGVLLGIFSSVLLAGTLLSTPSPLILKIKP